MMVQEAFENALIESMGILKWSREQAAQKLVNIERNMSVIHGWFEKSLERITNELAEQQIGVTRLNDEEARLAADEKRLIKEVGHLNTQMLEIIIGHPTVESKLQSLEKRLDELSEQMSKLDRSETKSKTYARGLAKDAWEQNYSSLVTDYSGCSNLLNCLNFASAKLQKPQVEKEIQDVREIKAMITNLVDEMRRKNDEIAVTRSEQARLREARQANLDMLGLKQQKLKVCEKNTTGLVAIAKKISNLKIKISSLDKKCKLRNESALRNDWSSLVAQVLDAQKLFLKLEKNF